MLMLIRGRGKLCFIRISAAAAGCRDRRVRRIRIGRTARKQAIEAYLKIKSENQVFKQYLIHARKGDAKQRPNARKQNPG